MVYLCQDIHHFSILRGRWRWRLERHQLFLDFCFSFLIQVLLDADLLNSDGYFIAFILICSSKLFNSSLDKLLLFGIVIKLVSALLIWIIQFILLVWWVSTLVLTVFFDVIWVCRRRGTPSARVFIRALFCEEVEVLLSLFSGCDFEDFTLCGDYLIGLKGFVFENSL